MTRKMGPGFSGTTFSQFYLSNGKPSPIFIARESADSKLSPIEFRDVGMQRKRPYPVGPRCAATYVSIRRTCPRKCILKNKGCYVQSGYTNRLMRRLDEWTSTQHVNDLEAVAILYAFRRGVPQDGFAGGGRDLRLHVGGDVKDEAGARVLAAAADAYHRLGGGTVWTYTRRWREVSRDAWGDIAVLASIDSPSEWSDARKRGYNHCATVVLNHETRGRSYAHRGSLVMPCRHDADGTTCVECRRCLSPRSEYSLVAFETHGRNAKQANRAVERAWRR